LSLTDASFNYIQNHFKFRLDNNKSAELFSDFNLTATKSNDQLNNSRAAFDKLIRAALSAGKKSILFNSTTTHSQEEQTNTYIQIITTDDDEENDEQQQVLTTDNREYTERRTDIKEED
jgi:hypothetical protein